MNEARKHGMRVIAAEITKDAIELNEFSQNTNHDNIAVIFGNEVH